jgi:hypothetical protein
MELELEFERGIFYLRTFKINGKAARIEDFGEKYDHDKAHAEECTCEDMRFDPKPATQAVLEKYGITVDEYHTICYGLDGLSFGKCRLCS